MTVINIISPHASVYHGGMEVVTIEMARNLAKQDVTVRFFTRQTNAPTDVYRQLLAERSELLEVIEIPTGKDTPLPDGTWPVFYRISCDFGLAAQPFYAKYNDADLFITHLSIDSLFVPKSAKTVLHLHGTPDIPDPLMEAAVKIPVATIAHSHSVEGWWTQHFPHLKPAVFQNGVDTHFFNGQPDSDRPIDILYVGRFMKHKGIDDILHSIQVNQKVVIAGNGLYLPKLKEIVTRRGLNDSVTFYDTPTTKTIQQLYRQAKIFVCPSKGKEGVLTTLLEAGASGCAVITTSGSGMTDVVKNDLNGIVILPADTDALQDKITYLLHNDTHRIALASTLQKELRENWSWDKKSLDLKEMYDAVV